MKEGLLAILKFFFFLIISPLIFAFALSFQNQILNLPAHKEVWVLWGAGSFILIYFFLYKFKEVYVAGETVVSNIFSFLGPVAKGLGVAVPIYTVLLVAVYAILNVFGLVQKYEAYFLLVLSFSIAMHIVLSAHQLYEGDNSPIKGHYFCTFGLAFMLVISMVSLLLGIVIPEYSIVGFFKSMASHTAGYYQSIYSVLFVAPS